MPCAWIHARNTPAAAQIVSSLPMRAKFHCWRRPPCSSSNLSDPVPRTSRENFHPFVRAHPHAPSALVACDAPVASVPGSITLPLTSSVAGSAHSPPHHPHWPNAQPLTSARIALLPPRNISCLLSATPVREISLLSFGSTPVPRYDVSVLPLPLLDSVVPISYSVDNSLPSSPLRLPALVHRFLPAPICLPAATPYRSSLPVPI